MGQEEAETASASFQALPLGKDGELSGRELEKRLTGEERRQPKQAEKGRPERKGREPRHVTALTFLSLKPVSSSCPIPTFS